MASVSPRSTVSVGSKAAGRARIYLVGALALALVAAGACLLVLTDVGWLFATAGPVPSWSLIWRTASHSGTQQGQGHEFKQAGHYSPDRNEDIALPADVAEISKSAAPTRDLAPQAAEQFSPSSVSHRRRDLARECSIAFVAAVTSPPDGKLSPLTMEFTESMLLSALSKHYSACAVVITNVAGNFNFLKGRIDGLEEVVYADFWGTSKTYMYDRTRAYVRFLSEESQSSKPRNLVFTDTDILYVKSLADIFDSPFDIGLTYRNMPKYPINNGIMFAHKDRLQEASNFWEKILKIYEQENYDRGWQGDQYAVCKFMEAAGKYFTGQKHYKKQVGGVDVKLLHISGFNFPPRSGCKIGSQVRVLHFKGGEKSKLPQAW
eukprot:CAMPEP_0117651472 /NCGR_PEP_ID=MMETSP0804-20121206/2111_1 /TAXON_ID=1074897 /ORGANISM="Tetraselmis astigmatica, Strain CCMP880" /LENGTH=376 /DNA_ID=CAMNT_0005457453 /DNA_START=179 /DNA_END=1306 /DNA_ORIENTATION=+